MTVEDTYWSEVVDKWRAALRAATDDAPAAFPTPRTVVEVGSHKPLEYVIPILVAGYRGMGKSALYKAMVNDQQGYVKRRDSDHVPHRLVISRGAARQRATLVVTPGQHYGEEFSGRAGGRSSGRSADRWDAMLTPPNSPAGVIYVVSAGYDEAWRAEDNYALEAARRQRERTLRAALLEKLLLQRAGRTTEPPDEDEQRALSAEVDKQIPPPNVQLAGQNRATELRHMREIFTRVRDSWEGRSGPGRPWLIVAVTKADLYAADQMEEVEAYYLPAADRAEESPFVAELREFIGYFGTSARPRLAILPISSRFDDYRFFPDVAEKESNMKDAVADALLHKFLATLGDFCGV